MAASSRLLTASKEQLAAALWRADFPDREQADTIWAALADDLLPKRLYLGKAEALIAEGAVVPVASLADDAAVVERVRAWVHDGRRYFPATTVDYLRALAAAMEDR